MRILLVILFLSTGCAANAIQIDRGEFAIAYADLKSVYTQVAFRVRQLCAEKKLKKEDCKQAAQIGLKLDAMEQDVRMIIRNPGRPIDWQRVGKYFDLLLKLAVKTAL